MSVACDPHVVVSKGGAITVECVACMLSLSFVGHAEAMWAVDKHLEDTIRKLWEKATS